MELFRVTSYVDFPFANCRNAQLIIILCTRDDSMLVCMYVCVVYKHVIYYVKTEMLRNHLTKLRNLLFIYTSSLFLVPTWDLVSWILLTLNLLIASLQFYSQLCNDRNAELIHVMIYSIYVKHTKFTIMVPVHACNIQIVRTNV